MWKRIPHLMQQYNTPRKVLTNLVTLLITKKKIKNCNDILHGVGKRKKEKEESGQT